MRGVKFNDIQVCRKPVKGGGGDWGCHQPFGNKCLCTLPCPSASICGRPDLHIVLLLYYYIYFSCVDFIYRKRKKQKQKRKNQKKLLVRSEKKVCDKMCYY